MTLSLKQDLFKNEIDQLRILIDNLSKAQIVKTDVDEVKSDKKIIKEDIQPIPVQNIPPATIVNIQNEKSKPAERNLPKGVKSNVGKFIGENLINKIGIIVLIIGVGIGANAGTEAAEVSISFKKDDFVKLFPIFADVIKNPSFPQVEVEKRKQRWIAELEQDRESSRRVIRNYFNKFVFRDMPYGNPVDGTKKPIEGITPDELRGFFNLHYPLSLACIAIVGDFNADEMKTKVESFFPSTPKVDVPLLPKELSKEVELPLGNRVLLVNKDDSRETTFMIGGKGVAWNNQDIVQIDIINTILGGRFTSWLNTELRINSGLTYGARSSFPHYKYNGTFYAYSFTGTENTVEAIDLTLQVFDRLHKEGIDQETLTSAKNYMKGQFPPDYETAGALADFLTTMFFYGLDDSYLNDFDKNVDAMTVEKAKEIIVKYFPKEELQFVLIGKADEIRDKVSKYGKVTEKSINEDKY